MPSPMVEPVERAPTLWDRVIWICDFCQGRNITGKWKLDIEESTLPSYLDGPDQREPMKSTKRGQNVTSDGFFGCIGADMPPHHILVDNSNPTDVSILGVDRSHKGGFGGESVFTSRKNQEMMPTMKENESMTEEELQLAEQQEQQRRLQQQQQREERQRQIRRQQEELLRQEEEEAVEPPPNARTGGIEIVWHGPPYDNMNIPLEPETKPSKRGLFKFMKQISSRSIKRKGKRK